MRFVFTPAKDNDYDRRLIAGLAGAIEAAGHQVKLLPLAEYTRDNLGAADFAFAVNHARPGWLPPSVRHIAWVQDFLPGTYLHYGERKKPGDVVYVLTNPDAQGVEAKYVDGALLTGVSPDLLITPLVEPSIDLSLCGFVPPPLDNIIFDYAKQWPGPVSFGRFCHAELEKLYKPLCGDLRCIENYKVLHNLYLERMTGLYTPKVVEDVWKTMIVNVGHWVMDHPRRLDRTTLARMMLLVTDNCVFRGKNWESYGEFAAHSQPHTDSEDVLLQTYRQSRVNLHTNSDGYGPHSRVLEAMAVGGFIMTHSVRYPEKGGCMSEHFTPGVHFGEFTLDNFAEQANYWLKNVVSREWAIKESRGLIEGRHLWRHRAAQLLKDLGLPNNA
jgi:Glycosyl transferases group 1